MLRSTFFKGQILSGILFVGFWMALAAAANGQSALDGFDPNVNGVVRAVVVQPDGKIIIGGDFTSVSPNGGAAVTRNRIARFNPDGTLDTGFDPNANDAVRLIAVQPDGKILAGGDFLTIGGQPRNRIARLDAATGAADSFDPNANSFVLSIAVQPDGKILAGGFFTTVSPNGGAAVTRNRIARFERDGLLDRTLDLSTVGGVVTATAIQPDGKIIIGGGFTSVLGTARNNIARLNTDGSLDTAFNPNANGIVYSIALQSDGTILIGGEFTNIGGTTRNNIARLNTDGSLDTAFNPNASRFVYSIAVQADGKILIGGAFFTIGGTARNFIARLNPDGSLDTALDPNASSDVRSITVQADGKILIGGAFTTVGGTARNIFARLTNDTAALSTLTVTTTTLTLTRDGSAPQFSRVIFEQSINNGANYTLLGTATNSLTSPANGKGKNQLAPTASGYTLGGQNIPTGQNVLIRARGFYRAGYQSGSETIEDKVQTAFLLVPSAASVSIGGRVFAGEGRGLSNAFVVLTDQRGASRSARTNSFGYYRFDEVAVGETYTFNVRSKRFQFAPQVVSVTDELAALDFFAEP